MLIHVPIHSLRFTLPYRDITNCEVVTAWAGGCTWTEALQISGLPPGDLARTLSRALDALRQLGNLPYVPVRKGYFDGSVSPGIHPDVRRLCRQSAREINRYPLKDTLAFESGEGEEEEEEYDEEIRLDGKSNGNESLEEP